MGERLAIVLPAFNEASCLETLIWRLVRTLQGYDYRIVLVDDGSTDETVAIAESLTDRVPLDVLRHDLNSGYGASIRTGLLFARSWADVVVTMDADDSHDPSLIPRLIQGIACGSDVVIASRFVPGGREVGVPLHRRILSRGAGLVFKRLLRIGGVGDYTSGYRAYRATFLDELVAIFGQDAFLQEAGFTVGVELLVKTHRVGGQISELPLVLRYDRKRSESKLDIRATMADYARLLQRLPDVPRNTPAASPVGAGTQSARDGIAATLASDVVSVFAAFLLSFVGYRLLIDAGLINRAYPDLVRYAGLAALFALTTVLIFWRTGLYAPRTSMLQLRHLQEVAGALTISIGFFFTVLFFASGSHPSRLLVAGGLVASYPLVLATRRAMTTWIRARRIRQGRQNRALILGAGKTGRLLMKKILEAPRLGMEVVGFLDDRKPVGARIARRLSQVGPAEASVEVCGGLKDLHRVALATGATDLFVTISDLNEAQLEAVHWEARELGLSIAVVPRLGSVRPDQLSVDDVGAIPVIRRYDSYTTRAYEYGKRALDLIGVAVVALPALCIGLATAALIRLEGPPVLFRQTRVGRDGRLFTILKFRTMHPSSDPYAASPTDDSDPRLSNIGRIVRGAGLDELPQLINVLRGEMSLVGPRPEMSHVVAAYGELERARLVAPPGITGLWQLSPDRADAIHDNMEYDLYYLRHRSLSLDLLILGETGLFVTRALGRQMVSFASRVVRSVRREPAAATIGSTASARGRASLASPREGRAERHPRVFVALDQRRRPDEPASWSRYLPAVASLSHAHAVRVLMADRNSRRIRALADGAGNSSDRGLDFVPYEERTDLTLLTESADVVVTDLPHLADFATREGRPVLVLREGEILTFLAPDAKASVLAFTARVKNHLDRPDDRRRAIK